MRLFFLLGLFLSFSAGANAQTIIKADALVDVIKGRVIANPRILINDGRIESLQASDSADAEIIDLSGHTLLPGMIDMHVHLTSSADEHGYKRLSTSKARAVLRGSLYAKQTLLAGVTSARNLGAPGFIDVALRDAINAKEIVGPRLFVSGPSLSITGGHCDNNLLPIDFDTQSDGVADGPWDVAKAVRRNIKYGANVIKVCATGGVLSKGTKVGVQQYSLEELSKAVSEAHRRGITVAAHAHGTEGITASIKAGVDSVEHASFIDDEGIKLAKKNGTVLSMDIYVTEYILSEGEKAGILEESLEKERQTGGKQRENFRKAVEAGVKMVMGTDAGVYPHGDNLKQLSRMVEFGMTPMQALQAASINAAELLNQESEIGSVSVGKLADIIAVKGDPIDDISLMEEVKFVMQGGQIVKSVSSKQND